MIFRFSFLSIVYFAVICSAPSANYATDKPDYKLISPDKICHAVYHPRKASYFNKTPSTYVSVSCGGGAYGVFEAEGNHYKLKLEWLNDLNLKITHPKGITIKDQLGAIRKRTGIGERKLTISYDPPWKPDNFRLAFIGTLVSIKPLKRKPLDMDSGFKLEYSVIKVLHGKYEKKQIEFKAYDHYGPPRFLKYPHVILFLSRYRGELYHEKYRFFDVYPTKNGRWAICGDTNRFRSSYTRKLKPVKVSFKTPMIYDLRKLHPRLAWKKSKDPEEMSKYVNMQSLLSLYSKQYFKIKHDKAICLGQGIYAEDLVNTRYSKDPLTQ